MVATIVVQCMLSEPVVPYVSVMVLIIITYILQLANTATYMIDVGEDIISIRKDDVSLLVSDLNQDDYDTVKMAVRENGLIIESLDRLTKELCFIAVQENAYSLKYTKQFRCKSLEVIALIEDKCLCVDCPSDLYDIFIMKMIGVPIPLMRWVYRNTYREFEKSINKGACVG